ncbi:hypothetical protein MRB53_025414 [Persea americana]|uniref:Uncharacterized protein n=1 Tax=Persea americana TaxID=3435 RepID=A0ACC2LFH7_PERAE|nr:hypothetical protein MRB53_025414 [Persea americana]
MKKHGLKVSILDRFVMGSGAGISIYGHFRVATENTVFAMPETKFGLFPDNGASYVLSRLPGFIGEYLGLAGATLDGAEMLACSLATHFVHSSRLPYLEEALIKVDTSDPAAVNSVLDKFSQAVVSNEHSGFHRRMMLEKELMCGKLKQFSYWKKHPPISPKSSLRSIREGRYQSRDQYLRGEYRMLCLVFQGKISNDFYEGSRAMFLVKDKNPKWEHSKLELKTEEMVGHYFSKVNDEEWEDLKLPTRGRADLLIPVTAKL